MPGIVTADIVTELEDIAKSKQEHFIVFSLDLNRKIIAQRTVYIGTLTGMIVHPREVFADPITDRAVAIIIAHNHPSGDVYPSKHDITTTQQLISGGQLLGVHVEDHIIVGGKNHFSFRRHGLMDSSIYALKEDSI